MNGTSNHASTDKHRTFGGRVAAAREAQGMDRAELAAKLGLTSKTVAGWEAGTSKPRSNKIQMLAAILNVSLRWLMSGAGDVKLEGAGRSAGALSADNVRAILTEMRKLEVSLSQSAKKLNQLEKRLQETL